MEGQISGEIYGIYRTYKATSGAEPGRNGAADVGVELGSFWNDLKKFWR